MEFREQDNTLLNRISMEDRNLIWPHLRPVRRPVDSILYNPGQYVQTVFFPLGHTLVSFVVEIENAHAVETTMVGREGAVGGVVSQGNLPAFTRIMVQAQGEFLSLPVTELENAKLQSRRLDNLFARYSDCLLAQIFQSTACNACHSVEQRAAKWIIAATERTGLQTVPLTQERLAAMLGVGRSYMSRVIQTFKHEHILNVRRGKIEIYDSEALKQKACSCNEAVKAHFHAVLSGVYPTEEQDMTSGT